MGFSKFQVALVYILVLQLFCALALECVVDSQPGSKSMEKDPGSLNVGTNFHGHVLKLAEKQCERRGNGKHRRSYAGKKQSDRQQLLAHQSMGAYSIEHLRTQVQSAIEVEHFILPPYLTAWFSIKDTPTNKEVKEALKSISEQEMLHFGMAANILNAIGGSPDMSCSTLFQRYPARVPGGLLPGLRVPIEKMSLTLTKNTFMVFELPEETIKVPAAPAPTGAPAVVPCEVELKAKYCAQQKYIGPGPDGYPIVEHNNTIGGFYANVICEMTHLECEARERNSTIFTGDVQKQVTGPLGMTAVTNLNEAVAAIELIVDQGEGSSVCIPYQSPTDYELSHYYRFESIYKGHQVMFYNDSRAPEICHGVMYYFNGTVIPFNPSEVFNMVPNPRMQMYPEGSDVRQKAEEFNESYTRLLQMLHDTFNGSPGNIREAISQMFDVGTKLRNLLNTPIPSGPFTGFAGGPTYDCVSPPDVFIG